MPRTDPDAWWDAADDDAAPPSPSNVAPLDRMQLVAFTGLTPRMIDKHVASGMPCTRGAGRGSPLRFDPPTVIQWLLREAAGENESGSLADLKRQAQALTVERRQIEMDQMRGTMIEVEPLRNIIAECVAELRDRFLSIPDRLETTASARAAFKAEVVSAINDLALPEIPS